MKNIITAAVVLLASGTMAHAWEMPPIPTLQEQFEQAKIDEVVAVFQSDPYFAGKVVDITMFGKRVAVDRKGEAPSPAAKAPSNLSTLTQVLDGLDASAKGSVQVEVTRQFYDTGLLKEEKWNIIINGQYNLSKEPLAPAKEDKGAEPQP